MNYTILEMEIALKLKQLKKEKQYIALSLYPAIGDTIIRSEGNRMFINGGRGGKWDNVSELFFDEMVNLYDSRSEKA